VDEAEFSLRDFLTVLRRRKAIFLQTCFLVIAIGVVVTLATRPLYRSTSRILVEGKTSTLSVSNTSDPLAQAFLPPAGHDVDTQVEMLRGEKFLASVYKATKTTRDDVYLEVRQVGQTDVVEVSASSASPDKAQEFAQQLPKLYLATVKDERLREVKTALEYAQRRLKEKRAQLAQSETALERFKTGMDVVDPDTQRSKDIDAAATARLTALQAQAAAASAAARLAAAEEARRKLPDTIVTPVTTTNNAQIDEIKKNLADLNTERNKRLFFYKEGDDKIKEIDNQIADMKKRLAAIPATTTTISRAPNPTIPQYEANLADARAAYASARADLAAAQSAVGTTQAALGKYNPIERTESQLQSDITDGQSAVTALAKSVEDLSLRKKAAEAAADPVKLIATASRAEQIAPRTVRNIILSVLLGLMLGCGAAMLQESLDDHISDEDEARHMLGTPVLGHSPRLMEGTASLLSPAESDPHLLERFRVLRSNVQFSLFNRPSRSLLITSTSPGEGKTSTASNLAVAMAMDKRRIILVDADLRRPRVHEVFGMDAHPGLTNVLVGQVPLAEALRETSVPGLRILTSGALPPNSAELLNSPAMDELLRVLEDSCDTVIFDSPPVLATADAQILAAKVDGVAYVMELGKVHKSAVQRSFELLHQARARIIGIVFNKVDQDNAAHSYYGYYGEYVEAAGAGEVSRNGKTAKPGESNGAGSLKKLDWRYPDADSPNGSATAEATRDHDKQ
jgi:capsular exopolysaccharide synthesis family protein